VSSIHTTAEWQTIELCGIELTADDRALVESLHAENKLRIDELRDAVRVQSFSWIGVLRFSHFELRITPKLTGEYAGLLAMLEYVAGIDVLRLLPTQPVALLQGEGSLLDLLALLLTEGTERIVRHGLLADYREREGELPVVRGRLLADRQLMHRFGQVDRLECRFDEQLTNIPENQILSAALGECRRRVRNPKVLQRVRRLSALFESECSLEDVYLPAIRGSLVYNRLNAEYRDAHALAWIILDALGIEDIYATGDIRCFGFLLDMNALFEAFVSKWLAEILRGTALEVHVQRRDRSILWDATRNCPYGAIIPDVLIENSNTRARLPIDAKYKTYDSRMLDSADMYQAFLYAFAYGGNNVVPRAFLFYPASTPTGMDVQLQVRRFEKPIGGEISAMRLHIPTLLTEVRSGQFSPRTLELRHHIQNGVAA
jgi:5-methylcytosine-specific restriction enzyme subunit McrC